MDRNSPVTQLKGIGEKNAKLFEKLNIRTLYELVSHLPKDYEVFEEAVPIGELKLGERNAFLGIIQAEPVLRRVQRLTIVQIVVRDNSGDIRNGDIHGNGAVQDGGNVHGSLRITFFNMPYLKNTLKSGKRYVFLGTVYEKNAMLCMDHPKMYKPEDYAGLIGSLQPVYTKTKGLSNDTLKKYISMALTKLKEVEMPEFLPAEIVEKHNFCSQAEAFERLHHPADKEQMMEARKRLAYEEFFFFILSLKFYKNMEEDREIEQPFLETAHVNRLLEALPYRLTASQQKAWEEIKADLLSNRRCNRLLQGDVGSGKTIIAVLSLLMCAANGRQGAFMAPTEVLAKQHFASLKEMTDTYHLPFQPVLLVGSLTAKQKKEVYTGIETGAYNLIIGTHALIQENVQYQSLALVVTDEQHRFGVKQREALAGKGEQVHTLVMSATPIPRSLAIILYGDLDISTIPELPAERLAIKNCVVNKNYRSKAYSFIAEQVAAGRQAYIICPMIESGIMDELENVADYSKMLRERLPETVRIESLHGKMSPAKKNRVMEEFGAGNIDVLVSTTVIEVGINVPNATVMMVENADRFGLSALHQIRGRVGRGKYQSYCIFLDTKESKESAKRLKILNESNDGFYIAEEDLKLRGPGDLMGIEQSGEFAFRFADVFTDSAMLKEAAKDVDTILKKDSLLNEKSHIGLKERLSSILEEGYLEII